MFDPITQGRPTQIEWGHPAKLSRPPTAKQGLTSTKTRQKWVRATLANTGQS
jgi:hypothetical protein